MKFNNGLTILTYGFISIKGARIVAEQYNFDIYSTEVNRYIEYY